MVKPIGSGVSHVPLVQTDPANPQTQAKPAVSVNTQSSFTTQADPTTLTLQTRPAVSPAATEGTGTSIKFMTSQMLSQLPVGGTNQSAPVAPSTERPSLQPLTLGGSVGAGGQNRPEDVRQVQQALQAVGYLPAGELSGRVDQSLTDAISRYQRDNHLPVVDGRIDVSKYTMNHLNQRAQGGNPSSLPNLQTPGSFRPDVLQHPFSFRTPLSPQGPGQTDQPGQTGQIGQPSPIQGPSPVAPPSGPLDAQLQQLQQRSVASAQQEWQNGVRESGGPNRGPRIDQYARSANMSPGGEWCGYFTGFNYTQNGFRDSASLASYQKARDYFMYRSYTSNTGSARNQENDQIRTQHAQQGSSRQYFMLEESPTRERVTRAGDWGRERYGHYDANANTFNYQNLPVRGGDTVLFNRGHVGMVESYDPRSGLLTTLEGNTSGMGADGRQRSQAVVRKTYDLSDPAVRQQFDGFGRPSALDFQ